MGFDYQYAEEKKGCKKTKTVLKKAVFDVGRLAAWGEPTRQGAIAGKGKLVYYLAYREGSGLTLWLAEDGNKPRPGSANT